MPRIFFLAFFFCPLLAAAQPGGAAPQMADSLRADGKIWVVVGVLAAIFAGIVIALIRTDRKIARLERDRNLSRKG